VHIDDLKPEAGDPRYKSGQGSLIWQFGAEGCRTRADADLAVIEFRAQRGTRLAGESDLICLWPRHESRPSQSGGSGAASVLGRWVCVTTLPRVTWDHRVVSEDFGPFRSAARRVLFVVFALRSGTA
jgi:hypothetical protein